MADNSFKKQNFNTNVRVSNQTINQLKSNKTFAGNVAQFKKTGMNAEQREAMNRFYGKARTSAAFGNAVLKNPNTGVSKQVAKPGRTSITAANVASQSVGVMRNTSTPVSRVVKNNTTYKPPTNTARNATAKSGHRSFLSKAGGFVANELLGVDDFKRTANYVRKGQFGKAGKSALTGISELGSTVGAAVAAVPTGGGSIAAKGALIAAKQGAKVGAKAAVKQGAKSAARATERKAVAAGLKAAGKAVVKSPVKTIGRGSISTGVKGAVRTTRYATSIGTNAGMQGVRAAKSAAGKAVSKAVPLLEKKVASAAPSKAQIVAATMKTKNATKGLSAAKKTASPEYKRLRAMNKAYQAANKARTYRKPALRAKAGVLAGQGVAKAKKTMRGD